MGLAEKGGFGTMLVLAFVIVVLGVGLGLAISISALLERISLVGGPSFFEEEPAQTTTSPVVVAGIQNLN